MQNFEYMFTYNNIAFSITTMLTGANYMLGYEKNNLLTIRSNQKKLKVTNTCTGY